MLKEEEVSGQWTAVIGEEEEELAAKALRSLRDAEEDDALRAGSAVWLRPQRMGSE